MWPCSCGGITIYPVLRFFFSFFQYDSFRSPHYRSDQRKEKVGRFTNMKGFLCDAAVLTICFDSRIHHPIPSVLRRHLALLTDATLTARLLTPRRTLSPLSNLLSRDTDVWKFDSNEPSSDIKTLACKLVSCELEIFYSTVHLFFILSCLPSHTVF